MKGKVIVITGGTKGVGKALADAFGRDNTVIVISRRAEQNDETSFACDVGDSAKVRAVFEKIGEKHQRIDLLINNAGFGMSGATELISDSDIDAIIKTNLYGAVNCTKYALPYMQSGSRIINISSASAILPMPFRTMYSVTKSAVMAFSDGMRMELSSAGIDVTCICLGDVQTDFVSHRIMVEDTNERYGERIRACDDFVAGRGNDKKMPLDKVAQKVTRIADKKRTMPTYILGAKYRLAYLLYKLTSRNTQLRIIDHIFKG